MNCTWISKPYVIDSECSRDSDIDNAHSRHFVDDGVVIEGLAIEVEAVTGWAGVEGDEEDEWFTHVNWNIGCCHGKLLSQN